MNKYDNQYEYNFDKNNGLSKIQESWLSNESLDYWRHSRMFEPIIPLIRDKPGSSWITIGDGRLGLDSIKLKSIESKNYILPTDINIKMLEIARQMKLIEEYKKEDAEKLNFDDVSFDYAFCKESFHHFQKPYIALYEMIRVSKKAIILIEPSDDDKKTIFLTISERLKKIIKVIFLQKIKHSDFYRFEKSGNYVYTINKRDIEKAAIAMQLPVIAIFNFNDYYQEGIEFVSKNKISMKLVKVKYQIIKKNIMAKLGISMYTGIIAIIFKEKPNEKVIKELEEKGFEFTVLPKNPYINII